MEFRNATPADAALLAKLNKQLIDDERHRNPMSVEQLAERMSGWLAGEYRATIFSLAGEVAGYTLFRREPDHLYIRQFFIDPAHRRKGCGRAAIAWLRAHEWADAPRLRLDVLVGNERAVAFWRAVGFSDYCLTMEANEAPRATYSVLRQDDNGNAFVVESGLTSEEAEQRVGEFESRGHKQTYWVQVDRT